MKTDYSKLKFTLDTRIVTFYDCVMCASEIPEFAQQMDRLFGTHIMRVAKANGIIKMIDDATGYADAQIEMFCALVYETVWLRLDPKIKISFPEHEKMLADKYEPILKKLMQ